jgi:tRNA(adenine34) deaminase
MDPSHKKYMAFALLEAEKAGQMGEVPIGAILVADSGEVISAAHNRTINQVDPTAHAEILALRNAAIKSNNYRLINTSMFVTIEPCIMCMGALVHARVKRVVYGANDPKWGAAGSLYNFSEDLRLNHWIEIIKGVREEECRELMQAFFRAKRT